MLVNIWALFVAFHQILKPFTSKGRHYHVPTVQEDARSCLLPGTGINESFRTESFFFELPDAPAAARFHAYNPLTRNQVAVSHIDKIAFHAPDAPFPILVLS
jgi:hypothetical protein